MFAGVFNSDVTEYNKIFTVAAGITIILSAVYTLNMLAESVVRQYKRGYIRRQQIFAAMKS